MPAAALVYAGTSYKPTPTSPEPVELAFGSSTICRFTRIVRLDSCLIRMSEHSSLPKQNSPRLLRGIWNSRFRYALAPNSKAVIDFSPVGVRQLAWNGSGKSTTLSLIKPPEIAPL